MNNEQHSENSLRDLIYSLNRRRHVMWITAGVILGLAVLACILMTRRYEAVGVFELQKSSSDALDLSDIMGSATGGASDSLTVNTELQTEASILQSRGLALQVIKELNLEKNKDFEAHFSPVAYVFSLFSPAGPKDPRGANLEDSPIRRERMLKTFKSHLTVKVDAGTRLIDVQFSNRDPKVAAAVVNHLIQALIDYNFQTKYNATNQVSDWLQNQLGDLRKQSENLRASVVKLQQGSGIFGVGGTDLQGKPVVYSPVLDRLQESSSLLTQAKMNLIVKESVYKIAKSGDAELISELAGTTLVGQANPGVSNSLAVIQSLRGQEATLRAQIGQESAHYGPAAPKLIADRAALKSVEDSLRDETSRIAARAKSDYDVALSTEKGAESSYLVDQKAAESLNNKTIEYTILSREAEESDQLYQDLLKRLKEAGILEGLHSSNLTVVDVARTPDKPNRPNIPMVLFLGLFGGLALGAAAALLTDAIDNKVLGSDDVEAMNLPLLGILPQIKIAPGADGTALRDTRSSEFNEAIRHLRSALLIARSGRPPQVILVTSGSPAEGKSTTSVSLAETLSKLQKRVLLVEADMRRPVLKKRMGLRADSELSTFLVDPNGSFMPATSEGNPNLFIIPAGPTPPYPSELLGAAPLNDIFDRWREEFDFIVIDSPPILPVTDVQILMPHADATILIARASMTSRVALQRAFKMLAPHARNVAQPAIGILLNGISTRSAAYYGYYGTYGYKNYYGSKEQDDE